MTRTASRTTSGPIPSPGITAILFICLFHYARHQFRQTRQHGVANDLHALRGNFVDCVVSFVPVRITGQLNDIDRVYSRTNECVMIVAAYALFTFDKNLSMAQLACGGPDDVLQPLNARRVATEFEFLVTDHVEQNQRERVFQFIFRRQLRYVMAAAVSVVRVVGVTAIGPSFAESFFAVEEHELERDFLFLA